MSDYDDDVDAAAVPRRFTSLVSPSAGAAFISFA